MLMVSPKHILGACVLCCVGAWAKMCLCCVFTGAGADLLAALLLCSASLGGPVALSVINGKVVVKDGKLLTADVGEISSHAAICSNRLSQATTVYTP